jgi:hypothetical protein
MPEEYVGDRRIKESEERSARGAAFGLEVRGKNFTASSEALLKLFCGGTYAKTYPFRQEGPGKDGGYQ